MKSSCRTRPSGRGAFTLPILLPAALLASCAEDVAPVWFEDVALEVGVDFRHVSGFETRYWFPEIMSGGVALGDFDGDADLDLYLVQGGDLQPGAAPVPTNRLYENVGDGEFRDATVDSGTGDIGYGMGCATGDYDGDGDLDLYVTNVGPNVLYRNDGNLRFTDVTAEAGVGDVGWGAGAAFLDYDGDGDLDLFLVNYIGWASSRELECPSSRGGRDYCNPNNYDTPARDVLYRNDGGGRFTEVSEAAGLHAAFGNGLGIAWGDVNGDGRVDVYVANDGMPNQLWMNVGGGRFEDRGLEAGCAVNMQGASEAGMGVAMIDIDDDGDLDLFMTHLRNETNTFYLNDRGLFTDRTPQTGLSGASIRFTGFGMGFADFDCDGTQDLYVANGRVGRWIPAFDPGNPYAEPDQVFRGLGGTRFEEVMPRGGTAAPVYRTSRGTAFGDIDQDGDIDVVVVDIDARVRILRNVIAPKGHWTMLRLLEGAGSDALGARVRVTAGGRTQWRTVQTAYSYLAANDPRVHFGLGPAARVDEVLVQWPDGTREVFGPLAADKHHVLQRGTGRER
ncbi:MAG: CRTAC1 family protein [Planctomycetota bacterium]|nr:MAG: CRTAC1 family protein [Planctomycetota bacterium]